jgi:hypothetical protein
MSVRSSAIGGASYTEPGFGAVIGINTGNEGGEISRSGDFLSDG